MIVMHLFHVSCQNLVLHEDNIRQLMIFVVLITCRPYSILCSKEKIDSDIDVHL